MAAPCMNFQFLVGAVLQISTILTRELDQSAKRYLLHLFCMKNLKPQKCYELPFTNIVGVVMDVVPERGVI